MFINLLDDNADIFAASLVILYCSFPSLNVSSIVMITLYILSKRLQVKRKRLSDARVFLLTKKEYDFAVDLLYSS